MSETQVISVERFQELLAPMPRPIIEGREIPDWVTVTHPPDWDDDHERGYDLAQALSQPTDDVPPYMVKDILFSLPMLPRYSHTAGDLRDLLDYEEWVPIADRLQKEHDISTRQLRRATQRVQATGIGDHPEVWPEAYTDYGIDEQHHGVTFDDIDREFDTVETALKVYSECCDSGVAIHPLSYPDSAHHLFSTSIQLIQGKISWADFLSSKIMTDSMVLDDLREGRG